jgi:hypothetical protein
MRKESGRECNVPPAPPPPAITGLMCPQLTGLISSQITALGEVSHLAAGLVYS